MSPPLSARSSDLPDNAYAAAISALPDMTPMRLLRLLRDRAGGEVYERLLAGDAGLAELLVGDAVLHLGRERSVRLAAARELVRWWSSELAGAPASKIWGELRSAGATVVRYGDGSYPSKLGRLEFPPELLYVHGDLHFAEAPTVAIVGTRRATHYGIGVAEELGAELAARGACIVSGLALGIDAAAHAGALARRREDAGPLAVVGGGLDVVYPERSRSLWARVRSTGAVTSEAPLGARPLGWRFPLRNRIIAGLSDVIVVVESSRQGGSMHTAEAGNGIGVPVLAVPGSIRSAQSEGTNWLISQGGAHLALDVEDVLAAVALVAGPLALRLFEPEVRGARPGVRGARPGVRDRPDRLRREEAERLLAARSTTERAVYELLGDEEIHVDVICESTSLQLGQVVMALDRLAEAGLAMSYASGWVRA